MATGWMAMRFGWSSYIVPFLFVYSPAILMKGSWWDILVVTLTSLAGIWLICAAMVGYFTRVLPIGIRLAFVAAGIMLLLPHQASQLMLWLNIGGVALASSLLFFELRNRNTAYSRNAILP
jgi:TRAP-type uncharacterized transport system fused permease subunit